MRYIDLSKVTPDDKWISKAQEHLNNLQSKTHKERREYFDKYPHWTKLKDEFKRVFGKRCWYTESDIREDHGDVDHFRPKNKSIDEDGGVILGDGYWWLAYDYHNYRLSGAVCNESFKKEYFPLKKGTPAANEFNDDDENLLLDPCKKEDCDLIDCDEKGEIISMSPNEDDINRVNISKKIYRWNAQNDCRKQIRCTWELFLRRYEKHYNKMDLEEMKDDIEQMKNAIEPIPPYFSFALKYIYRKINGKPYESFIRGLLKNAVDYYFYGIYEPPLRHI